MGCAEISMGSYCGLASINVIYMVVAEFQTHWWVVNAKYSCTYMKQITNESVFETVSIHACILHVQLTAHKLIYVYMLLVLLLIKWAVSAETSPLHLHSCYHAPATRWPKDFLTLSVYCSRSLKLDTLPDIQPFPFFIVPTVMLMLCNEQPTLLLVRYTYLTCLTKCGWGWVGEYTVY